MILEANKIEKWLKGIYVDDRRNVVTHISPGMRFNRSTKLLEYGDVWRKEDEENGISAKK